MEAANEPVGAPANSGHWPRYLIGALVAAVVAVAVGVNVGQSHAGPSGSAVTVTGARCAPGWSVPASGVVTYQVTNRSPIPADPEITNRRTGAVAGAIQILAPGTTRPLTVSLTRGRYQWQCLYDTIPTRYSSVEAVTGGVPLAEATPQYLPTTAGEMAGPLAQYRTYVANQITVLQTQVATLQADVAAGDLAQAKVDWLTAHLTYCTIGGTYGALGGLEQTIDGLASAFPRGVDDPGFTGFHKIEYQLWSNQPASAIAPSVAQLSTTLEQLDAGWPEAPLTANLFSTRAHEILEDTQRDTLSGNDNYGSDTSLDTMAADLQGEQVVFGLLTGLLRPRDPGLVPTVESEFASLRADLAADRAGGRYLALSALSSAQRERLDADVGRTLETLSAVPDLVEVQQFANFTGGS